MLSIVYLIVVTVALIVAISSGAVFSLLLALAASVVGATFAACLRWPEPMIWLAQLAAPVLLLFGLTAARLFDRLGREANFRRSRPSAEDFWSDT
ncbi:hypothetical protein CPJ18_06710 [Agrobacterium rosae]|uniref:Uncharacterized protein n=1 Tax=Agrobacterium rosae TaxID=1972867 RepID=A0AAE5S049_9HYPH|nr:hypothetical protein DXM21_21225 [Agrobacterium rosae]KAA3516496.1 hypothetical protein DXM25_19430 [Agrobacterium rosae]MQB50296.1 hypothetical protein [Agrobacterium rosae]POO52930.1 hypothetical protein CPJ18_06710 [Agrobacterium rosae]